MARNQSSDIHCTRQIELFKYDTRTTPIVNIGPHKIFVVKYTHSIGNVSGVVNDPVLIQFNVKNLRNIETRWNNLSKLKVVLHRGIVF